MKKTFVVTSVAISVILITIAFSFSAYAKNTCGNFEGPFKKPSFPVVMYTGFVSGISDDQKCEIDKKVIKPYMKFHRKSGNKVASVIISPAGSINSVQIDAVYFIKGLDKQFYPGTESFPSIQKDGKYIKWEPEDIME